MTDEELNEIKSRVEKAVPGPWQYDGMHYEITAPYSHKSGAFGPGDRTGYWVIVSECRSRPDGPYECDQFGHEFDPTFDFIAHAREDVPALIAEIERLRTGIHDAMQACKNGGGDKFWHGDDGPEM